MSKALNNLRNKWLCSGSILFLVVFFNVTILYAATVTLSWNPPETSVDGSPLTDLGGYVIYIGSSPDEYTEYIDVENQETYILDDLVHDQTYYVAVTAYDTSGNESDYSNQESILISSPPPVSEPPLSESAPDITVSDSVEPSQDLQLLFGEVTEFNSSDQTITVKNLGDADLELGSIVQSGSSSSPFRIYSDSCSWQNIAPSGSCSLTVRFSPVLTGPFSDSINIPSNDSNESMVAVVLNGTGLSSDVNNPPTEPELVSPGNRGKGKGGETPLSGRNHLILTETP